MESKNDQVLKSMELIADNVQTLTWEQLLPFIAEEAPTGDRCPIFTI
ncbi:hypothetical protein [Sphingobacterium multivorum]